MPGDEGGAVGGLVAAADRHHDKLAAGARGEAFDRRGFVVADYVPYLRHTERFKRADAGIAPVIEVGE